MIENRIQIPIDSQPDTVFNLIDTMPNKFPVYKVFETKPFLFLRILLFDGYKSAVKTIHFKRPNDELILQVGDHMGPFTLIQKDYPSRYWFRLDSLCINCTTGYTIKEEHGQCLLNLDLIAENPKTTEKAWWFFAKPVHVFFAKKVLKNIKQTVEYTA